MKRRSRQQAIVAPDATGAAISGVGPSMTRVGAGIVVGAHGGAGTTTLARFLGPGYVEVSASEVIDEVAPISAAGVVVVCEGTASAVVSGVRTALALAGRGGDVVLAVVADGPVPAPIAVRARLRAVRDQVAAVVRVPYVPGWRFVDEALQAPGGYLEAITKIRAAAERHETGVSRSSEAQAVSGASEQRTGTRSVRTAKGTT